MSTTDLNQIVLDNLFSIFKGETNINAFLTLFANKAQETVDVCETILSVFDIDLAYGPLLDIMGGWIGCKRPPLQEVFDNIFTLRSIYDDEVDPDNSTGFYNASDGTGGYMCSLVGIPSQTYPGSYMADDNYREAIKTKARTFRKKATLERLFNYYLEFGATVLLEDETSRRVNITQISYDDLNNWQRNYIRTNGFKPGGIKFIYTDNLETEIL